MKKSLLMTIIMTLVLVVAMSTATYAWYTSSSKVSVATTTVTTATSSSSNLGIGAETTATTTSHTISYAGTVAPMVPISADGTITTTTKFGTANETTADAFANVNTNASPATFTSFYVNNLNKDAKVDVKAKVTINDTVKINDVDQSLGLCVAIFVDGSLLGVWSSGTVYYATSTAFANGQTSVLSTTVSDVLASATESTAFQLDEKGTTALGESSNASISVIAWFDGVELVDVESGSSATFTIDFNAYAVA